MTKKYRFIPFVLLALAGTLALQACMAGGWQTTRKLAAWNNKFPIVPRILIYIAFFILPVYEIVALVDSLWFNIGDFWNGRVSSSNQKYHKNGMDVSVVSIRDPMRHTTITSRKGERVVSTVELKEQVGGKIALFVNGTLRSEVNSIHEVNPELIIFKDDGKTVFFKKNLTDADVRLAGLVPQGQPDQYLNALGVQVPTPAVIGKR